ncbi:polygalacturonase QRT3 [Nicotiana tabacum]|uniref:Polygalacturonase QRT3 n=2 Tax=Nicotiana TaxID=4085 RepID=A0A1S4CLU9_TOBAC|nr:PREDICTED: polygalacturonase QRT3 [Nicotiana sylvestris]XP_016502198.1 PREDICTED: polygalacturonase QRT3 [Nicotiana tabacum]
MQPFFCLAFLFLLLNLVVEVANGSLRQLKLYEFQKGLEEKFPSYSSFIYTSSPSPSPEASVPNYSNAKKSEGRVIYPIGYGADPTGTSDSSEAIKEAIGDALKLQNGLGLLPGISDLGGAIIDFQGGNYRINNPIVFPPGVGNIVVKGGTIRASDTFPGDRHLIELWSQDSPKLEKDYISHHGNIFDRWDQNFAIRYEGITFRDILFDSGYRGGGLYVIDSARIRITSCFFVHFSTEGVLVQRGHETFISDTFLGQHPTIGGDRGERDFSGIAIDLASNDNAITDVTIFSSAIGIVLRGEANIVTGVHCYNKATYFGGVGILVKASQNRIDNCYLDYNSIVIEDPFLVHISNGYFLGEGNVVLKAINGRIFGLNVINNMFSGNPSKMTPMLNLDGEFTDIDQVVIDQNNVNGMSLKSTAGKLTVAGNGTSWVADFSSILVFPNKINHVQYSFYCRGGVAGFPAHAVTNVSSNVVVIESEKPVDGVVSVFVDQHNIVGEKNFLM